MKKDINLNDLPTPIDAVEGTQAFEYISGRKHISTVMSDPNLLCAWDTREAGFADGGWNYQFKDGSSVCYIPEES